MSKTLRILALAFLATAACGEAANTPVSGGTTGSTDLPDGGTLVPDAGQAVDGGENGACAAQSDCVDGQVCIVGRCAEQGSANLGNPCTASHDCASGLFCSPLGFCSVVGAGAADAGCASDVDCAAGLRCTYQGFAGNCGAAGTTDLGGACSAQSDCVAGLFCSSGTDGTARSCQPYAVAFPIYSGPSCQDDGSLRVYFEVPRPGAPPKDFFRLPYPSDIRVTSIDGGGQLDISDFPTPGMGIDDVDLVALYKDALTADFNGFSTIAPVTFRFSATIDFGSLNSAIQILDLTEPNASGVFFYYDAYVTNGNHYNCQNRLTVGPNEATPFKAGHTYAVVLTSGITDGSGNAVEPDADLSAILTSSPPSDASLQHAYDAFAPLRSYLADANNGLPVSSVVGASVFTVANPLASMGAVAAAVQALPAPTLSDLSVCGSDGGAPSTCDSLGPDHACATTSPNFYEIHGRMSLPIFQTGAEPYLTPDAGGGIAFDASGAAIHQRDEAVCFALTIPKSAAPASGWPLLITHHGTGGSMTNFISEGVAPAMAIGTTPMAVLGFDAVEHADRRGGSTEDPENLVFNVLNPRAARDNFLQGAADILSEAKFASLNVVAPSGPASVTFDSTKIVFFGHSQGSTSGELALPFLDAAPTAVLSGASSHLTQSLLHKTNPIALKSGLALLLQEDINQLDTEHPVLGLFQNYFDRSDPISSTGAIFQNPLAGHIAHSVFMTWGTGDTYTPLETLQANAVSLGVPVSGTVLEGAGFAGPVARPVSLNITSGASPVTAVMVQYPTPTGDDGHFVAFNVPGAVTDWTNFIQSSLVGPPMLP